MAPSLTVGIAASLLFLFIALPRVVARRVHAPSPPAVLFEPVERHRIDLRQLLEDMPRSSGETLRSAGVELEQQLPQAALCVWADADELRRMFAHIACIACDAMPRGGILKTLARTEGEHAVVSFMDSSLASEQPRLAQTFDRLAAARQEAASGDSEIRESVVLSRRIADRHGGRLYAAPSSLGGLGITFRMPLASVAATQAHLRPLA